MPPTNFFRSAVDEEPSPDVDEESADLESVLDESLAVGLPEVWLGWHYRSRHDSLIAFSNAHIYDGKLEVFPAADLTNADLGVELQRVPRGGYERGHGTNAFEAEALVAHLCARLRAYPPGARSFGVVTFGIAQREVIENLLERERERDPAIDAHFDDDLADPVFIKNLENVQGDERDEILLSVTYGPDAQGAMLMNFGPLNRKGGERRLNVAVTRARRRMTVFSTIGAGDIDLTRTQARGAQLLKEFLRYAEFKGVVGPRGASLSDAFDSDFERQVYDVVRSLGYEVHTQVGSGGYRIDLGVIDRASPGRYLLAIECDGAAYHSAVTARDRDRLRQAVLEGLGWRMHRIWSTDWWYRRDREVARLRSALEEAARAPGRVEVALVPPMATPSQPDGERAGFQVGAIAATAPPNSVPPYTVRDGDLSIEVLPWVPPTIRLIPADAHSFPDSAPRASDVAAVRHLITQQGPLHGEELARCLLVAIGGKNLTAKWVDCAMRIARACGSEVVLRAGHVWPASLTPMQYWRGRIPAVGQSRDLELVCDDEIAAIHAAVLVRQLSASTRDLHRATARMFGIERVGQQVKNRLDAGLQTLMTRGVAMLDGEIARWRGGKR
jgi:very-short-patch-repair endonuclease